MPNSLQIALKNDSDSSNLHAYITGIALQQGGQFALLKADGHDLYIPQNPPAIGSSLTEDCAIPLGAPGNTTTVTIPQIAGGRIWIADGFLTFLLNPGPALVEPSVLNPSDPNANVNFGFCEFTLNSDQLYANISYVDFVPRIPIGLSLTTSSGPTQVVTGMAPDGLDELANLLALQAGADGWPWNKLTVTHDGQNLRTLNATHGGAVGASFDGYYEPGVEAVWAKYGPSGGSVVQINTQAGPGVVDGTIDASGNFIIGGESFSKPNSADIFGCNSGPFTTGPSPTRNAIIPRLAAAFVRSTLTTQTSQPSAPSTFYQVDPTNHYAKLVHQVNLDHKGYAFAYDDVQMDGGEDQSGKVNAGDPVLFTVSVGGKSAAANLPSSGGGGSSTTQPSQPQPVQEGPDGSVGFPAGGQQKQEVLQDNSASSASAPAPAAEDSKEVKKQRRQSGFAKLKGFAHRFMKKPSSS